MDQNPLVSESREMGKAIADCCEEAGIDVTAAFWVKLSEDGRWYFYLASREVDEEGLVATFKRVLAVIRNMDPRPQLDILVDLKLVGAMNPITKDVLDAQARYGSAIQSIYRGSRLGNLAIDEAYFYRPGSIPASPA